MKAYAGFFIDKLNNEVYWVQVFDANESSYNMLSDDSQMISTYIIMILKRYFSTQLNKFCRTIQTPNKNSTLREFISNKSRLVGATFNSQLICLGFYLGGIAENSWNISNSDVRVGNIKICQTFQ